MIPRQFPHLAISPFLVFVTKTPFPESAGTDPQSHTPQKQSFSVSTAVAISALSSSSFMPATPGALSALMLGIAPLISALVIGSEGISSITSMFLATCSGLGRFSTSSKCPFHLCRTYTSFVNNLPALFLTMSILLGGSLHSLLLASYTPFICTQWAMLLAHSPLPFCVLFFNSTCFLLYSSCNLALSLADLARTSLCFSDLLSSNLFQLSWRIQLLFFLVF